MARGLELGVWMVALGEPCKINFGGLIMVVLGEPGRVSLSVSPFSKTLMKSWT